MIIITEFFSFGIYDVRPHTCIVHLFYSHAPMITIYIDVCIASQNEVLYLAYILRDVVTLSIIARDWRALLIALLAYLCPHRVMEMPTARPLAVC